MCSISSVGTRAKYSSAVYGLFIRILHHGFMRCDLHVHSTGSGMCDTPLVGRFCRESYSDPLAVYETLKRRGMTLVTLTDHNSIDGAEPLRRFPDFFLSEEVTCTMPSGAEIHLGVYGLNERDHAEIARRRADLLSLLIYLTERRLFFALNHPFSKLTGRRDPSDFEYFASYFPAIETRNGQMLLKSEPDDWSWAEQVAKGRDGAEWTGIRNFSAQKHLRAMKKGERAFFYRKPA